jgi:hypothetical protein
MNTEILKVLKDLRSDFFYQIESKFGEEKASKYPSIVDADSLINKLTICGVSQQRELLLNYNEYLAYMNDTDPKYLNDDIDFFINKSKFNNCG